MHNVPFGRKEFEPSCLVAINHQRNTIVEMLNEKCYETILLKGGNVDKARSYYEKMLQICDVATMLDIITNQEREIFYDKIHKFFSGIQIEEFVLPELTTHYFQEYSVIDLILVYKINIQEKINFNLQMYRNFDKEKHEDITDKDKIINACESMLDFAKDFSFLSNDEIKKGRDILTFHKKHQKIPDDKKKLIYVPEQFYTTVIEQNNDVFNVEN